MSIVSGTIAERIKLVPFLIFAIFLTGIIYPIQGSWTWGGGWLSEMGFSDFAGSTIVHSVGGWAALTGALIIGPRIGKYGPNGQVNAIPGSNLPLATIGTFILWFGWFGFNGGSQLAMGTADDAIAVSTIFINTFLAGAGGVLGAAVITRLHFGKTDVIQMLNGCIGGLVAITAEPLAPSPLAAILIGVVGGLIVVYGTKLLFSLKIDDVVGAVPAHLFAGIWGTLIVPVTNVDASFSAQLIGVLVVNVFVFIVAYFVFSLMKATVGLRLSKEGESKGTDVTETGVIAYAIRD
jgi:Amt family ammonium transporter